MNTDGYGSLVFDAKGELQKLKDHWMIHIAMMSDSDLIHHWQEANSRYQNNRFLPLSGFKAASLNCRKELAKRGIYVLD